MDIANETVVLLIGLVLGVVLTRANDVLKNLPVAAYAYTTLGLLLFLSTLVLGWLGIVCVVVAYLLYQDKGMLAMLAQALRTFFSFSWLKRKKKPTPIEKLIKPDSEKTADKF